MEIQKLKIEDVKIKYIEEEMEEEDADEILEMLRKEE